MAIAQLELEHVQHGANEAEGGVGGNGVASMSGYVYLLDKENGKAQWRKIGSLHSCTINLLAKTQKTIWDDCSKSGK